MGPLDSDKLYLVYLLTSDLIKVVFPDFFFFFVLRDGEREKNREKKELNLGWTNNSN